jgi:hypothetical protein
MRRLPLALLLVTPLPLAAAAAACSSSSSSPGSPGAADSSPDAGDASAPSPPDDAAGPDDAGISLGSDSPFVLPGLAPPLSDAFADITPPADPLDGGFGCDGSIDYTGQACSYAVPLHGGVTGVLEGDICGGSYNDAGISSLNFVSPTTKPELVLVQFVFAGAIVPGQPGGPYPAFADITVDPFEGGAGGFWETASDSCSVTLTSNACAPVGPPLRYVMAGHATCPQLALPSATTDAGPVTVGDFTFVASMGGP